MRKLSPIQMGWAIQGGKTVDPPVTPPVTPPVESRAWVAMLPEELRTEKVWADVKADKMEDAFPIIAKGYASGQKMLGAMTKIPAADAPQEEKDAFWTKIGRPAKAEEYDLKLGERKLPEGQAWDEGLMTRYKKFAYDNGLTKDQAANFVQFYVELEEGERSAGVAAFKAAEEGLRKDLGGSYDRKVALSQRAFAKFATPGLKAMVKETGIGSHPEFVKTWIAIAETMAEDGLIDGEVLGSEDKASAKTEMDKIMADMKGPYWNKKDPQHKATRERVAVLREIAFENERAG